MKIGYAAGTLAASCLFLVAGVLYSRNWLDKDHEILIRFEPELLDARTPPLLVGGVRALDLRLRNTFSDAVHLNSLRFSHPCVSMSPDDRRQLPVVLKPGQSWPCRLQVRPDSRTPEELSVEVDAVLTDRIAVPIGRAMVLLRVAYPLDSEPRVLTFGALKRSTTGAKTTMRLWQPVGVPVPTKIDIEASDPAISVALTRYKQETGERVYVGDVSVVVNPRLATSRFREFVYFHADGFDLAVPVMGWVIE